MADKTHEMRRELRSIVRLSELFEELKLPLERDELAILADEDIENAPLTEEEEALLDPTLFDMAVAKTLQAIHRRERSDVDISAEVRRLRDLVFRKWLDDQFRELENEDEDTEAAIDQGAETESSIAAQGN